MSFCGSLGCANNATCRTTLTNNEMEGSHVTYSECVCQGDWIGPKCEHLLSLNLLRHQHDVAELVADVIYVETTRRGGKRNRRPKTKPFELSFSVQYWTNDSMAMCNIMTEVKSKAFHLKGLKPGTLYTACASAVGVDLCFAKTPQRLNSRSNCVYFQTLVGNETLVAPSREISPVVAPLALTIFFVIILVIFVVILVKCRTWQHCRKNGPLLRRRILTSSRNCKCPCLSSVSTETRPEPRTDGWLMPKTANGRFRNYSKRRHPHPTAIPLTTIIEYKTEEAETSASPLVVDEGITTEEKS